MGRAEIVMQLYLDDDSVRGVLIRLLKAGGHEIATPVDAEAGLPLP